jgi:hypothetical protein
MQPEFKNRQVIYQDGKKVVGIMCERTWIQTIVWRVEVHLTQSSFSCRAGFSGLTDPNGHMKETKTSTKKHYSSSVAIYPTKGRVVSHEPERFG